MTFLANFLDWLYKLLVRALVSIKATWVQVTAALTSCAAAVGTMFSNFTWFDAAAARINDATAVVRSFVDGDFGMWSAFFGWLNIGRLVQCAGAVIGMTVGATVAILVTVFTAIFALVPIVLGIRAVLKAIRTGTGGILEP